MSLSSRLVIQEEQDPTSVSTKVGSMIVQLQLYSKARMIPGVSKRLPGGRLSCYVS